MRIPIDPNLPTPIYQQIESFLRQSIQTGRCRPRCACLLPASWPVTCAINRLTVVSAYDALEADGLIEPRARAAARTSCRPTACRPLPVKTRTSPLPLWQQELAAPAVQRQTRSPGMPSTPAARTGTTWLLAAVALVPRRRRARLIYQAVAATRHARRTGT